MNPVDADQQGNPADLSPTSIRISSHGDPLVQTIHAEASRLGFDFCRIIPITEAPHAGFFEAWLDAGRAGEMIYLAKNQQKRRFPHLLAESEPSYRSMLVLAVNHHRFDLPPALRTDPSRGIIASYAWGDDYHELIRPLLYELDAVVRRHSGRQALGKCLVDTGPVLERDWAHKAGLGFTGKNCCTIHPVAGSWLFLSTIMIPEVLPYDREISLTPAAGNTSAPLLHNLAPGGDYGRWQIPLQAAGTGATGAEPAATGTCGRCTRCLDGCPTDAFVGPFHLDPLRCISYWTIESGSPVPRHLRSAFGNRIFGCDICQDVCPWNRNLPWRDPSLPGLRARAGRIAPPLLEGFADETPYWLDQTAFSQRFRKSPVKRARRPGMLRNVCIALGNWGDPAALPALRKAIHDPHRLPRGHAAWALGKIARHVDSRQARKTIRQDLQGALLAEADSWVKQELELALAHR